MTAHDMGLSVSTSMLLEPAHAVCYPLIYNYRSIINDYMLREVVELLRKRAVDAKLTPFTDWAMDAQALAQSQSAADAGVLVNVHDTPIRHVGGMLLAGGAHYLFDAAPFIERRAKDVRCRFGYGATGFAMEEVAAPEDPAAETEPGSPASPDSATVAGGSVAAIGASKFQYDTERQRVYFQLREYGGIAGDSDEWIVQTLQLIGKHGPQGKVIYRAHVTQNGVAKFAAMRSAAASSPAQRNEVQTRMPLPVEEYLRESNYNLFLWCLKRDPEEMGAAIKVIRAVIEYYKYSFTVIRTVKSLLRSIRTMQRFARCVAARKTVAERRMLQEWDALEQQFKRRLETHKSLPGDEVDRIVNKMIVQRCTTTVEWKRSVIRQLWNTRKQKYAAERLMDGMTFITSAFIPRFSWWIDPKELMAVQQKRVAESLSAGPESVFMHPKVQALFIDSVGEREIIKQAVSEARDIEAAKLNGRRLAAFGSTESRSGGPEFSLTVDLGPPTARVRSWDLQHHVSSAAGDDRSDARSDETPQDA